jgi:hypothetical protein
MIRFLENHKAVVGGNVLELIVFFYNAFYEELPARFYWRRQKSEQSEKYGALIVNRNTATITLH